MRPVSSAVVPFTVTLLGLLELVEYSRTSPVLFEEPPICFLHAKEMVELVVAVILRTSVAFRLKTVELLVSVIVKLVVGFLLEIVELVSFVVIAKLVVGFFLEKILVVVVIVKLVAGFGLATRKSEERKGEGGVENKRKNSKLYGQIFSYTKSIFVLANSGILFEDNCSDYRTKTFL